MRLFKSRCPDEVELFDYLDRTLPGSRGLRVERHLASCDLCRESIALMVQLRQEDSEIESSGHLAAVRAEALADETVKQQTEYVLALIARHERRSAIVEAPSRIWKPGMRWLPAPALALAAVLMVAIVGLLVYEVAIRKSPAEKSMIALAIAVETGRRTDLVVSGVKYAEPAIKRAGPTARTQDDYKYDAALLEVKEADSDDEKQVRARALISRAQPGDFDEALALLTQVRDSGSRTAELFNDTGVAQYAIGHYDLARAAFTEALTLKPDMPQALFNRALTLESIANQPGDGRAQLLGQAREDLQRFLIVSRDPRWTNEANTVLERMR